MAWTGVIWAYSHAYKYHKIIQGTSCDRVTEFCPHDVGDGAVAGHRQGILACENASLETPWWRPHAEYFQHARWANYTSRHTSVALQCLDALWGWAGRWEGRRKGRGHAWEPLAFVVIA